MSLRNRMFFIIVVAACSITFVVSSLLKIDPEYGKKKEELVEEEIEEKEG